MNLTYFPDYHDQIHVLIAKKLFTNLFCYDDLNKKLIVENTYALHHIEAEAGFITSKQVSKYEK